MAGIAAIVALALVLIGVFAHVPILLWLGVAAAVVAVVLFFTGYRGTSRVRR